MKRFLVRAAGEVIGWSHLETGDPAMGVASGDFHPNERYRHDEHATSDGLAAHGLTVKAENGREIGPNLGVAISDSGSDQLNAPLWIDVLGLDSELYREAFPEQYDAYFGGAVYYQILGFVPHARLEVAPRGRPSRSPLEVAPRGRPSRTGGEDR